MRTKTTVTGVAVAAALAVPAVAPAQTYTQPVPVPVPVETPPRDLTPEETASMTGDMVQDVAQQLGISQQQVAVVTFGNGGVMVYARTLDEASRSELRSDDGLQLGRFGCTRAEGCETGLNMKYRMGGRIFYNKKTVELLRVGERRTMRIKVSNAQRRLLMRATRIRPAFALRMRDPATNSILGNAKRMGRFDLP